MKVWVSAGSAPACIRVHHTKPQLFKDLWWSDAYATPERNDTVMGRLFSDIAPAHGSKEVVEVELEARKI